jgi:hypothetical protein
LVGPARLSRRSVATVSSPSRVARRPGTPPLQKPARALRWRFAPGSRTEVRTSPGVALGALELVGPARFELATSSSRTRRSTKLSHGPIKECLTERETISRCEQGARGFRRQRLARFEDAGEVKIFAAAFTPVTLAPRTTSHSDAAPLPRLVIGSQSVELVNSGDSRQLGVFFANKETLRQLAIHADRPADKFEALRMDVRWKRWRILGIGKVTGLPNDNS